MHAPATLRSLSQISRLSESSHPLALSRSFALSAVALALVALAAGSAEAGTRKPRRAPLELNAFGPARPLTETAWLVDRVGKNRRFELGSDGLLALLERYDEPQRSRAPEWRSFWYGRYGRNDFLLHPKLVWWGGQAGDASFEPAQSSQHDDTWPFESGEPALRGPASQELVQLDFSHADVMPDWSLGVAPPEPEFFGVRQQKYCPHWQMPRAVSVVRYDGAEFARLPLVDCRGAIAPDAIDRLSVLARPPATPKPDFPLPLEPDEGAPPGEWLPKVKLLHPRLIWAVQQIALAFPNRSIFIMSGYRPDSHGSYHQRGRALDLFVTGVENADLFRYCHTLNDVGCGYYPNNKFVHVDVRPFGTHRVAWVDVSAPGTPSEYVTSWPGIELSGTSGE